MKMLVNLRGVPEDEAMEIRQLLDSQGIDYYETGAGNWGIGQPGIWLSDPGQRSTAESLLAQYWHDRRQRLREEEADNPRPTHFQAFLKAPVRHLASLGVIGLILFFSIKPFFDFLR